jgi:hypothetical protein
MNAKHQPLVLIALTSEATPLLLGVYLEYFVFKMDAGKSLDKAAAIPLRVTKEPPRDRCDSIEYPGRVTTLCENGFEKTRQIKPGSARLTQKLHTLS